MEEKDPNAKEGGRIRLVSMVDDPNPIAPGTEGTIRMVDGMGVIHVNWDDGRTIGVIPGIDKYQLLDIGVDYGKEADEKSTDMFNSLYEADSGASAIKSAISKTPSVVSNSMPKATKLSSSTNSALKSAGVKTGQVKKSFKSANIKDVRVESNEIKGKGLKKVNEDHGPLLLLDALTAWLLYNDYKKYGLKGTLKNMGNNLKELMKDFIQYSTTVYGTPVTKDMTEYQFKELLKKFKSDKTNKTDYMSAGGGGTTTSSVGGDNGMGYTSPAAWAPGGVLTKKENIITKGKIVESLNLLKETTEVSAISSTIDFYVTNLMGWGIKKDLSPPWPSKNKKAENGERENWWWQNKPLYNNGVITDPYASTDETWDDDSLTVNILNTPNMFRDEVYKDLKKYKQTVITIDSNKKALELNIDPPNNDWKLSLQKGINLSTEKPKEPKKTFRNYKNNLKKEDLIRMVQNRLTETKNGIKVDLEKGDDILTGRFKNHKDKVKKIGKDKKNQPTVNDKPMLKFRIPKLDTKEEVKEEELDETTTFGSVWGSNGPPVGPAFAAKKGDWKMIKRPIWNGGTIVQKDFNSGIMNPINEVNKVKYNPKGKYVTIKKKCTKFPYCNQGAIDNPLNISDKAGSGNYIEETMKNIHEIAKQTGKSFDEVYKIVKESTIKEGKVKDFF